MIEKDKVVSIHYKLTSDGETIDTTEGREPLKYLHGHKNIVPGLESALDGRSEGDKFQVEVTPEEGYGERDESQIQKIPRKQIQAPDLKPGLLLQANTPQGPVPLKVVEVTEEEVTVDANHALAGKTLQFDIEVVNIRAADKEEIDHGHVH